MIVTSLLLFGVGLPTAAIDTAQVVLMDGTLTRLPLLFTLASAAEALS